MNKMLWRQKIYPLCVCLILNMVNRLEVYALHCKTDTECPKGQYCYMENSCTPFTNCTVMFNREEGSVPARDAHQCGNCIKGYYEEEYTSINERSDKCMLETEIKNIKPSNWTIILPVIGSIVISGAIVTIFYLYLKKKFKLNFFNGRSTNENQHVDTTLGDQCAVNLENSEMLLPVPTAPLDESNTYEDKSKYNLPDVRIRKELDCIEFQCARVSVPPFYVSHANYGTNDIYHSVDDTDASHQQVSMPNNNNVMSTHSTMAISTVGSEASFTGTEENSNNAQEDNNTPFKKKIVVNQTNYIKLSL